MSSCQLERGISPGRFLPPFLLSASRQVDVITPLQTSQGPSSVSAVKQLGLHQTKGETNLCRAVRQQDMEHFLPPCRHTLGTLPTTLLTLPVSLGTLSTNQSPCKPFLPILNYFIQPWDNFLPHNKYFLPHKKYFQPPLE